MGSSQPGRYSVKNLELAYAVPLSEGHCKRFHKAASNTARDFPFRVCRLMNR
jgi:hypothetical protein